MKKAVLATAVVLAAGALAPLSAAPAGAVPVREPRAATAPAEPYPPCGYSRDSDGWSFYQNCSNFNAGIRIIYTNGSIGRDCVLSWAGHSLGWNVQNAYTYYTC
ncbi:hypothetical protein AB0E69_40945 [Kribbella sp. NPDC026611]|uniref:hypothetical protein n=1 Tax=Kribbella sp. NPDC026611 TaxID=3154911 RepID=UPI0033F4C544